MANASSFIGSRFRRPRPARVVAALVIAIVVMAVDRYVQADLFVLAAVLPILALVALDPGSTMPIEPPGRGSRSLTDADTVIAYLDRRTRSVPQALPALIALRPQRHANGRIVTSADLETAAEGLRAGLRPEDVIGTDGDGNLLIALSSPRSGTLENMIQVALRLQRQLRVPVDADNRSLGFDAPIGICHIDTEASSKGGEACLKASLTALTRARARSPSAIQVAQDTRQASPAIALQLATDLDAALSKGQILPYFQPQISTDTGALLGVEALARWNHPEHGVLAPGRFLPTVEAAGAERALTTLILRQSAAAMADWDAQGLDVPCVSVNMTYADLNATDLTTSLEWIVDTAGLSPNRIGIEVLETVLSVDARDRVPQTLAELRDLGCQIDLDDFGTGQASIASIRRFRIDRLKIDRCFIRGLDRDTDQQSMVAAIVTMAEQLGLTVLAEGVETAEEHAMAAQLGCGAVQGYGIGRPMRAAALPGWLARWRSTQSGQPLPKAMRGLGLMSGTPQNGAADRQRGNGKTA